MAEVAPAINEVPLHIAAFQALLKHLDPHGTSRALDPVRAFVAAEVEHAHIEPPKDQLSYDNH